MTLAPFAIHELTADDVGLMRELNVVFGEAFEEPETFGVAPPGDGYLRRLLDGECFIALAALAGGTVVGGLTAYELRKYEQARNEVYIYDLAVAEPHRRRGIATALIGQLRRIAMARGAWVVFVQADLGDDPAIELYSGLGTREDVLHFDIPLG